jgi:hypothetical protein
MKLISWWGGGKIDQPLISGDKIVEFGIAAEPDWFTTPAVFMTVALMTPIGLFGYCSIANTNIYCPMPFWGCIRSPAFLALATIFTLVPWL